MKDKKMIDAKIYVISPYDSHSGGAETLHQIVSVLRNHLYKAYIYYIGGNRLVPHRKFENYSIEVTSFIEDKEENLLIVPETKTDALFDYIHIKKAIIWLSLDYYLNGFPYYRTSYICREHGLSNLLIPLVYLYVIVKKKKELVEHRVKLDGSYVHFYNCKYIKCFLEDNKIAPGKMKYICGPIGDLFFDYRNSGVEKKNIIAYNPRKGYLFTQKVISRYKSKYEDARFVAIENMDTLGVLKLLLKSKVYIDFGYFPGPERIPREAVLLDCCIITSNLGSASNDEDVPIPSKYKFSPEDSNIDSIVELLNQMINRYDLYYNDYCLYKEKVLRQRIDFENNVLEGIKTACETLN